MNQMKSAKEAMDDHRIFVHEDLVEAAYQRLLDSPDPVAQAATLERKGGPCPYCRVAFAKVEVDNRFGKFSYYRPACRCFPVCKTVEIHNRVTGEYVGRVEGCGRVLIAEKLAGNSYCTQCYSEPPGTRVKSAPVRKRSYGGKDAASGDGNANG